MSQNPPTPSARPPGRLLFATFAGHLDTNALIPIIALYAASLGADVLLTGAIVGGYSAVHAFANLLGGRLVDRIGRRWPLMVGLGWDAISLVLYAVAPNAWMLLAARLAHGMGGGLVGPAAMSWLSASAAEERRGRAMAYYGISIGLSVIIGFAIAAALAPDLGYRSVPLVAAVIVAGAVMLIATLAEPELQARPPTAPRRFLRGLPRALHGGLVTIFAVYFGLGAFTTILPRHLTDLGFSERDIIFAFVAFGMTSVATHYLGGAATDRRGVGLPLLAGLGATAAGFALIPGVREPQQVLLLSILLGAGHGLAFPSSSALTTREAPQGRLGEATGLFYLAIVVGVALGAPLSALAGYALGLGLALGAVAVVPIIGAAMLLLLASAEIRAARSGSGLP